MLLLGYLLLLAGRAVARPVNEVSGTLITPVPFYDHMINPLTWFLAHNVPAFRDWKTAESMANNFIWQLNLTEKGSMVTGKLAISVGSCIGNILPIERVGFPGLCMQDGPNGVNLADLVSAFPSGLNAGASWNKKMIYQRGLVMGKEFRPKGIAVALGLSAGPLGRHALGGCNWEGFSVDPYLSGVAIEATIRGIQANGVQACAKHIVANKQETQNAA
ncbi:hypothetical protein CEP54_015593 [Fusarium duplospermum]|uniref:beta-glucosidase n=1 Tax=Fusarium duplospermum TaxID=1325734 RepID=A0A428NMZ4_9HYPO|nr:hypothetical protein CEP54_015593 [Fusarium duplospermum]